MSSDYLSLNLKLRSNFFPDSGFSELCNGRDFSLFDLFRWFTVDFFIRNSAQTLELYTLES